MIRSAQTKPVRNGSVGCSPRWLRRRHAIRVALGALIGLASANSLAVVCTLAAPDRDNTIYSNSTSSSNAKGHWIVAGRLALQADVRRGLIRFDIGSCAIPPGSTVSAVAMELREETPQAAPTVDMSVYRLTQEFGEGTSSSASPSATSTNGVGTEATTGDATWDARLFGSSSAWSPPMVLGQTNLGSPSATTAVSVNGGTYTWSGAGMVSDVQAWVDGTATNHGWLIKDNVEVNSKTVKWFRSREHPTSTPSLTITYTAAAGSPDLVVQTPGASPTSAFDGDTVSLEATVKNQGSASAAATTLRWYSSLNSTIETTDTELGTSSVAALAANATSLQTFDTAALGVDTRFVGACVDTVSGETSTANQCSTGVQVIVSARPDLVVESPAASPTTIFEGESTTLSATVRNAGAGAASATTLRWYRSTDSTITTADTQLGTDAIAVLAAGATSAQDLATTALPAGTVFVGACVDAASNETATTNQCSSSVQVTVTARPDLVVIMPAASPATAFEGDSVTLSATVQNAGSGTAAASTLRWYRSTDSTITTADTELGTDVIASLTSGATSAQDLATTALPLGTVFVGACVDAVSGESSTANQCSTSVQVTVGSRPDLIVVNPNAVPATLFEGDSTTLSATVENAGTAAAAATTLRWYRSTDATITTGDTQIGTDAVPALAPAATSEQDFVTTTLPVGTIFVGACVDAVTDETTTTNQCSTGVAVNVSARPDLIVETPGAAPTSIFAGQSTTLSATVRNAGTGAAAATTLRWYRSTDATIATTDTELGTDAIAALAAGATSAQDLATTSLPAGIVFFGACVDAVNGETATANQCSTGVQVTVTARPDLVVVNAAASASSIAVGASVTLSATVQNTGAGAAGTTTLRWLRSTDSTITTADVQLGTDAIPALAAGATSAQDLQTSALPEGTLFVGACVDAVSGETSTANQCSAGVQVIVGATVSNDIGKVLGAILTTILVD